MAPRETRSALERDIVILSLGSLALGGFERFLGWVGMRLDEVLLGLENGA
jgi:hypothetical protein